MKTRKDGTVLDAWNRLQAQVLSMREDKDGEEAAIVEREHRMAESPA